MSFQLPSEKSQVQTTGGSLIFKFFSFFYCNKKMIEILTKIRVKITIIVVNNREPYYFIFYKCKEVSLSLLSYQMLASTFHSNEWSTYYKVYVGRPVLLDENSENPHIYKKNSHTSNMGMKC